MKLQHGGGQHAQCQHGSGGWIERFRRAVAQNRAVIDNVEFKKHIGAAYPKVKRAERHDIGIDFREAFAQFLNFFDNSTAPVFYKHRWREGVYNPIFLKHSTIYLDTKATCCFDFSLKRRALARWLLRTQAKDRADGNQRFQIMRDAARIKARLAPRDRQRGKGIAQGVDFRRHAHKHGVLGDQQQRRRQRRQHARRTRLEL